MQYFGILAFSTLEYRTTKDREHQIGLSFLIKMLLIDNAKLQSHTKAVYMRVRQ